MLDVFYGAFSPACFGLLGLWLVVVQIRLAPPPGTGPARPASGTARPGRLLRGGPISSAWPRTSARLRCAIGVLAFAGGLAALRTEAILLTLLVFLGFNVAWLLLFDDRYSPHARPSAPPSKPGPPPPAAPGEPHPGSHPAR